MKSFLVLSMLLASTAFAAPNVPLAVQMNGSYTVKDQVHAFTAQLQLDRASRTEVKYKGKLLVDGSSANPVVQKITLKFKDAEGKVTASFDFADEGDFYRFELVSPDLVPSAGREITGKARFEQMVCGASHRGCERQEAVEGAAALVLNY